MARTNKMWILKKKMQLQKQKKVLWEGSQETDMQKRPIENPKWNSYMRFVRTGKYVCDTTSVREDPDGYRIKRKPNSGEFDFEMRGDTSYWYRRYIKRQRHLRIK